MEVVAFSNTEWFVLSFLSTVEDPRDSSGGHGVRVARDITETLSRQKACRRHHPNNDMFGQLCAERGRQRDQNAHVFDGIIGAQTYLLKRVCHNFCVNG